MLRPVMNRLRCVGRAADPDLESNANLLSQDSPLPVNTAASRSAAAAAAASAAGQRYVQQDPWDETLPRVTASEAQRLDQVTPQAPAARPRLPTTENEGPICVPNLITSEVPTLRLLASRSGKEILLMIFL